MSKKGGSPRAAASADKKYDNPLVASLDSPGSGIQGALVQVAAQSAHDVLAAVEGVSTVVMVGAGLVVDVGKALHVDDLATGVGPPQHGLSSKKMARITSDCVAMCIHKEQMALITSDCAPFRGRRCHQGLVLLS